MQTKGGPRRLDRQDRILWWLGALALSGAGVAAWQTGEAGQMPHVWLFSTIAFTWLTLSWGDGPAPRSNRELTLTFVIIGLVAFLTALSMQAGWVDALRSAVGVISQATVMAVVYGWMRRRSGAAAPAPIDGASATRNEWAAGWAPTTPMDLARLMTGALVSGPVGLLIGAAPGLYLSVVNQEMALQWLTHVFVVTSVGGATTLITFSTWSRADLDQPWGQVLAAWAGSVLMLSWVYSTGAVNMAWLAVLPAIFIAMTCRIWVTSTFGLLVGLVSILLSPALTTFEATAVPMPLGSVMELLVSALILVALVLGMLNQRRDQLLADLASERTRAARQAEILESIFETMADGVLVVDRGLNVQMHNSATERLLGRPMPAISPAAWTEYFGLTRLDGTPLPESELIGAEFLTVGVKNGSRVLRQTVAKMTDDADDGWMIVVSDITEHQARVQELSGFAGIVAHDLRSPLTSLEGWLEMAEESLDAHEFQEASALLSRARGSNRRMREVITDWLDYTVEREGALSLERFPLAAPVRAVTSQISETGPHYFVLDTPHVVVADLGMVRQLLANLCGNASKFSRAGVTPHITVRSTRESSGWIRVDVIDEGIGLSQGEEERIFEEYHRGTGEASRKEGYGLGLAACRRIVERHGGLISAHTNRRGGTTVSFTLPHSAQPSA